MCSSKRSRLGFCRVAIRRVSACLCPPERSPTLAVILSSSPRSSCASNSLYFSCSSLVTPQRKGERLLPRLAARARFSSISMSAAVPVIGSWKTRPRYFARTCSDRPVTSVPSISMDPESMGHTPATAFKNVDFPAPLPPMTVTNSPSSRFRETPRRACFSLTVPALNVL